LETGLRTVGLVITLAYPKGKRALSGCSFHVTVANTRRQRDQVLHGLYTVQ